MTWTLFDSPTSTKILKIIPSQLLAYESYGLALKSYIYIYTSYRCIDTYTHTHYLVHIVDFLNFRDYQSLATLATPSRKISHHVHIYIITIIINERRAYHNRDEITKHLMFVVTRMGLQCIILYRNDQHSSMKVGAL